MTALHWAARAVWPDVVAGIVSENATTADELTYPARAPGNFSPLMSLVEADLKRTSEDDVRAVLDTLVAAMSPATFRARNAPKGNSAFHLCASRGNKTALERLCQLTLEKLGNPELWTKHNGLWPGVFAAFGQE